MKPKATKRSFPERATQRTSDSNDEIDDDAMEDAELNAICDKRQHEVAIEVDFDDL